jgi:hypothetical protein
VKKFRHGQSNPDPRVKIWYRNRSRMTDPIWHSSLHIPLLFSATYSPRPLYPSHSPLPFPLLLLPSHTFSSLFAHYPSHPHPHPHSHSYLLSFLYYYIITLLHSYISIFRYSHIIPSDIIIIILLYISHYILYIPFSHSLISRRIPPLDTGYQMPDSRHQIRYSRFEIIDNR